MTSFDPDGIYVDGQEIKTLGLNSQFITSVYGWFTAGLAITAITSLFLAFTGIGLLFLTGYLPMVIMLVQLGLVIGLSAFINKLNTPLAAAMFLAYSLFTGLTLSVIFYIYTSLSIILTFAIAAGMFGTMAIYGYTTKQDLTRFGNLALMGLIGLILASILNIFLKSSGFDWLLSFFGVGIFLVLTAWDTQKIKAYAQIYEGQSGYGKYAIIAALTLYLDFINLFIRLLHLLGRKRS